MILIVNCGSSKTDFIESCVDAICDFTTVPLLELTASHLEGIHGVILSGAPILITEQDLTPHREKCALIISRNLPTLGICFGHQLIGLHFGASAAKMVEDRDWQTIAFIEESVLNQKLPEEVQMMEDHCETISIPPDFKLLASSDNCINEAMKHNEKPIFGVQFHPEISGNHGFQILANFVECCLP